MLENAAAWRSNIVTGVIAGLIGGLLIDVYSFAAIFLLTGTLDVMHEFQFTASGLLGPSALAEPGAAWFGIVVHFALGIVWGIGYVYVASRTPQLHAHPALSGFVYGVVVYLLVLLFDLAAGVKHTPETTTLGNALIAHTLFFGIPIALVARARQRT
jgi:hypothetical protein